MAVHPVGCATKEMNRGRDEGGELYLFSSVLAAVAAFRIASVAVLTFCGIIPRWKSGWDEGGRAVSRSVRVRLSARAGKPSRWKETVAADVILFDNGFRQTYTIMHNNAMPAGVLRPADEVEAADPQGAPAKSGVVEGAMGESRFFSVPCSQPL